MEWAHLFVGVWLWWLSSILIPFHTQIDYSKNGLWNSLSESIISAPLQIRSQPHPTATMETSWLCGDVPFELGEKAFCTRVRTCNIDSKLEWERDKAGTREELGCWFELVFAFVSPWIVDDNIAPDKPLDSAVLSRLKHFSAMNKLKKMALRVRFHFIFLLEEYLMSTIYPEIC